MYLGTSRLLPHCYNLDKFMRRCSHIPYVEERHRCAKLLSGQTQILHNRVESRLSEEFELVIQ